ncbi:unnamed protein product, partial [marine sediment metagenome]
MKVKILKIYKKIDDFLFSDTAFILGFLANLGLVTGAYIIFYSIISLSFFENIIMIWRINIFTIIYLLLHGMAFMT